MVHGGIRSDKTALVIFLMKRAWLPIIGGDGRVVWTSHDSLFLQFRRALLFGLEGFRCHLLRDYKRWRYQCACLELSQVLSLKWKLRPIVINWHNFVLVFAWSITLMIWLFGLANHAWHLLKNGIAFIRQSHRRTLLILIIFGADQIVWTYRWLHGLFNEFCKL